jgi:predicted dehydrogenase
MTAPCHGGSNGPLRIALIGAGNISYYHLIAWARLGGLVRVVAICDPDLDRARRRAEEFGISRACTSVEEILANESIDVFDIASPRETHAAYVELAAARGIDVLCQKPLAPTLAEAEALIRRVSCKHRLMVHENWRFRPWYRKLGKWIEAGELGKPTYAHVAMFSSGLLPDATGRRHSLERQPFMVNEARLMITEVLIHHLDVLRWLLGPLRVISARVARTVADAKGDTLATVFLETASGNPVVLSGTIAAPGFRPVGQDDLTIIGSEASATLAGAILRLVGARRQIECYDSTHGYQASFDGVMAHFVDRLRSGAPFETDPVDNLETLRLVEHAYWAAGLHPSEVMR